jgi:SpoIID/LytB domain protein
MSPRYQQGSSLDHAPSAQRDLRRHAAASHRRLVGPLALLFGLAAGLIGAAALPPLVGIAAASSNGRPSHRPRAAPARRAHSEPTLLIEGAGDGHGVGMSQWGALGDAQHGWSYQAILAHYYSGTSLGSVSPKRMVKVLIGGRVKKVPIEAYVRGVVAAEMPSSWPAAALQAQAIASRTYAITDHAGGKRFDVYSDARSQMYLGKAAETQASNEAVKATAGQIVTYEGRPAITPFFASSGGRTESNQNAFLGAPPQPWLKGVLDPYDGGPLHRWTIELGFSEAARALKGLVKGSFQGIEVVRRGFSPRIVLAYVLGSKGKAEVSGPELAARLGLYDSWAYFSAVQNGKTRREPDLSGPQPPAAETSAQPPATTGAQGGVSAP